jgi:hypothetical protein
VSEVAKLRVKRKAHKRNGTKIPASTFLIKDRGKKGRTPEEDRFFQPEVHTGWKAGMSAEKRRRLVKKAHKSDLLAAGRSMQALANVQHRINPDVAKKAKSDADYFYRLHAKRKKK